MLLQSPLWSPLQPLLRNPLAAARGASFSPLSLFAGGEQGLVFDMSNAGSRFVDTGTTPVVASGDLFGKILDLSGRGNHAGQITSTSRPKYDLTSGLSSALFDGADDSWQTFANLDLSGTDKVTVIAGVRKLSDASAGVLVELGPLFTTAGTFGLFAPTSAASPTYYFSATGASASPNIQITAAAPDTAVLTGSVDLSAASAASALALRRNGVLTTGVGGAPGARSLLSAPLNLGRRNNASVPFNGHLYSLIIIGRLLTAPELANAERWTAQRCGVSL